MSLPQSIGFCLLIVGVIVFGAKVGIDGEPTDVLALIGMALATGYMGSML
jgi:hypothetical protein